MRTRLIPLLCALLITASCASLPSGRGSFEATGTMRYIALEGDDFYEIVAEGGKLYYPVNLPMVFEIDGLPVKFTARLRRDVPPKLGRIPIEILSIERIVTVTR